MFTKKSIVNASCIEIVTIMIAVAELTHGYAFSVTLFLYHIGKHFLYL